MSDMAGLVAEFEAQARSLAALPEFTPWDHAEVVELAEEAVGLLRGYQPTWAEVTVSEVLGERDRARAIAVRLEQELAEAEEWLWAYREEANRLRKVRQAATVEAAIKAAGLPLIKEPGYGASDPMPVSRLYVDEKKTRELEEESHERLVELAGDGLCAYVAYGWDEGEQSAHVAYAVKGWRGRGLHSYYGSGEVVPTTPEEVEKAKQERRVAREKTKAWKDATVARVEFLQGLVAKKTMPKGWEPPVVGRLLDDGTQGTSGTSQWRMAIAILKLKESSDVYSLRGVVSAHLKKAPTRALQIGLAVWAGSIEGGFEFDRKGWDQKHTKQYLELLESWGHVLSECELGVVGRKKGKAAV